MTRRAAEEILPPSLFRDPDIPRVTARTGAYLKIGVIAPAL
ncbi:MAG: DUF998 domain-containing protein, partial [Caulobacter sp.]